MPFLDLSTVVVRWKEYLAKTVLFTVAGIEFVYWRVVTVLKDIINKIILNAGHQECRCGKL